jgi:hypothetical protein
VVFPMTGRKVAQSVQKPVSIAANHPALASNLY